MKIQIRFVEPKDYYKVAELSDSIFKSIPNKSFFSWDRQGLLDELKLQTKAAVAETDQKMVGFIAYRESDDLIDIMTLGTALSARGQQVMGRLIDFLLNHYSEKNKNVLLEVHEQNRKAIQLYLKKGFQVLYKRERYYKDGGNALAMQWSPV